MEDYIESEEIQEVAEPDTSESEEIQEVAEPEDGEDRTEQDRAFAEYRRRAEEAEREAERYKETLGMFFQGEDPIAEAIAYAQDVSIDEAREMIEEQNTLSNLIEMNEDLQNQLLEIKVEKAMNESLAEIQSLDPNIKSLMELGESFGDYIASGLSTKQAYYAVQAEKRDKQVATPPTIGAINQSKTSPSYLTKEEVEAHQEDREWVKKNYDLIRKSMQKW